MFRDVPESRKHAKGYMRRAGVCKESSLRIFSRRSPLCLHGWVNVYRWVKILTSVIECLLSKTFGVWLRLPFHVCPWYTSWIWVWILESSFHTPPPHFVRTWWYCIAKPQRKVSCASLIDDYIDRRFGKGTAKYQLSAGVQYTSSDTTYQGWKNWRLEIMKTFSRCVSNCHPQNHTECINLKCAIPAFEHLLPAPHNDRILTLLFELAYWHSLAKLRLHMDTTISFLETLTRRLGHYVWHFATTTCNAFHTVKLPSEETARCQWTLPVNPKGQCQAPSDKNSKSKSKRLNLNTYKWHALGDYAHTIQQFGTTDNYSTQTVSASKVSSSENINIYALLLGWTGTSMEATL